MTRPTRRIPLLLPLLVLALVAPTGCKPKTPAAPTSTSTAPVPVVDTEGMESQVVFIIDNSRTNVLKEPGSAAKWGVYGMVLDVHDITREARECYAQAAALDPADPRWPYFRALLLDQAGATSDDVVDLLLEAARLEPGAPAISVRLGDVFMKRGRTDDAIAAFARATEVDPTLAIAFRKLGEARLAAGDVDGAIAALERSDALHPESATTQAALAQAYFRVGRVDEANAATEMAGKGGADAPFIDRLRGSLIQYGRGLEHFRARAASAMQMGDFEKAIRNYVVLVRERPDNANFRTRLAMCRQRTGDVNGAYRDYRQALEIDAEFQPALLGLGTMLVGTTRVDEAMTLLNTVLQAEPENQRALVGVATLLGRQDRFQESLEMFERAAAAAPLRAPSDISNWGLTLLRMGRTEDAVAKFEEAIEIMPTNTFALFQLGQALERLGRVEEAKARYRQVQAIEPQHEGAKERLNALR